ncbi:cupin domain-containing protein [Cupriavidus basilensis]
MRPVRPKVHNPVNPLLAYPADRALAALSSPRPPNCRRTHIAIHSLNTRIRRLANRRFRTIGTRLQRLRPNSRCLAQRHTGSILNYVIGGSGTTVVNGQRFQWGPGDFIAIPPWSWYEHAPYVARAGNALPGERYSCAASPRLVPGRIRCLGIIFLAYQPHET